MLNRRFKLILVVCFMATFLISVFAQEPPKGQPRGDTSYMPVDIREPFASVMARMSAAKAMLMQKQLDLLNARYDLSNRPAQGVTMARGKPIQEGVRVKLSGGLTWEKLEAMSPEEIRDRYLFH